MKLRPRLPQGLVRVGGRAAADARDNAYPQPQRALVLDRPLTRAPTGLGGRARGRARARDRARAIVRARRRSAPRGALARFVFGCTPAFA